MLSWAQGKKTYIAAAFFLALVCFLVGFGQLTPELALDILAFALPCFAATFRSAIEAHHSQVLAALEEIAQAGADMKAHKAGALAADAEALLKLAGPVLVTGTSVVQSPPTGILSGGWPDKSSGSSKGAN